MSTILNERGYDVIVLGEVLVEVSTEEPVADTVPARIGISGDALNVAAAAAAAGARVGLVTVVSDDDLGEAVLHKVSDLGISTELIITRSGQQGVYFVHSDPSGNREFSYVRSGSVGSTLSTADLDLDMLRAAGVVIASGITCAISSSARSAVVTAADASRRFIFDPNFRPRLTTKASARATLAELAPKSWGVTPSHPGETTALLEVDSPEMAAKVLTDRGVQNAAVTCGAEGVHLRHSGDEVWINSIPAPDVVDQTGAGDSFVGTLGARLALGDSFEDAAVLGTAAASLVVGGRGGTGLVPDLNTTRAHAARHGHESLATE